MVAPKGSPQAPLVEALAMVPRLVILDTTNLKAEAFLLTGNFAPGASLLRAPPSLQDISQIRKVPPLTISSLGDVFWESVPAPAMRTEEGVCI